MIYLIIAFIILVILMLIYTRLFFKKDNFKTFIIKMLSCLMFLFIGVYSYIVNQNDDTTQSIILIGLIMCSVGDTLIGLRRIFSNKKNLFFLLGLLCFFFSHMLYIASLIIKYNKSYYYIFIPILLTCLGFIYLLSKTKIEFGTMRIPCYIYIVSSSTMFVISLVTLIMMFSLENFIMFIGVILFIISDSFLCYSYFKKSLLHPRLIKLVSVLTYFTGQSMIAFSMFVH